MTMIEKIDRLIEDRINAKLAEYFGETDQQTEDEPEDRFAQQYARTVERIESKTNRKRGPGRLAVQYVLMPIPRGKTHKTVAADLPPSYASVYMALVKNRKPATQRDLEALSGEKHKTVQSAVYQLRTMKLVKSEPIGR